jgi:hypothetical protein
MVGGGGSCDDENCTVYGVGKESDSEQGMPVFVSWDWVSFVS